MSIKKRMFLFLIKYRIISPCLHNVKGADKSFVSECENMEDLYSKAYDRGMLKIGSLSNTAVAIVTATITYAITYLMLRK